MAVESGRPSRHRAENITSRCLIRHANESFVVTMVTVLYWPEMSRLHQRMQPTQNEVDRWSNKYWRARTVDSRLFLSYHVLQKLVVICGRCS